MNKMEIPKHKAHLVINFILICFLFSCSSKQEKDNNLSTDDYLIIDRIIQSAKKDSENKSIRLNKANNNDYTIKILKSEQAKSSQKNVEKLEYSFINIDKENIYVRDIFNSNEYDFLISQSKSSHWSSKIIRQFSASNDFEYSNITISKPVYTSNKNYALVTIKKDNWQGIQILVKTNEGWIERGIIAPTFFQPKAGLIGI